MSEGETIIVRLPEDATIRHAESIAEQLKSALATGQTIEVDCSAVIEADSSVLQLLIAARKSAAAAARALILGAPAAGALRAAIIECGLAGGSLAAFWSEGRAAQ